MNNPDSILVIQRFYQALDTIIAHKALRGVQTFTKEYKINRWNFSTVRKKPESDMFQLSWITYLVRDFGVSARWIMTGLGDMFDLRN